MSEPSEEEAVEWLNSQPCFANGPQMIAAAIAFGREEGRQEEREAIVEWLRKDSANEGIMDFVATQIHDGDHRIRP